MKAFLQHLKRLKMSSRSMARKISTLKSFFTYLHHYAGWKNNLSNELITPKIEQTITPFFHRIEIEQLFRFAEMDNTACRQTQSSYALPFICFRNAYQRIMQFTHV